MPKQAANSALVAANKVEDVWSKNVQFTMKNVTLAEYKTAMAGEMTQRALRTARSRTGK